MRHYCTDKQSSQSHTSLVKGSELETWRFLTKLCTLHIEKTLFPTHHIFLHAHVSCIDIYHPFWGIILSQTIRSIHVLQQTILPKGSISWRLCFSVPFISIQSEIFIMYSPVPNIDDFPNMCHRLQHYSVDYEVPGNIAERAVLAQFVMEAFHSFS